MFKNCVFTSESVTEGHPDKLADQISDAILDSLLEQDPHSRVACETLVNTGLIMVAGEVTTKAVVDYQSICRNRALEIGYNNSAYGLDASACAVLVNLDTQSPDIAQGVNAEEGVFKEQGAGDQGLMFGYACNESSNYMPMSIDLAHKMAHRLASIRKDNTVNFLRPDGKTQVSVEYNNGSISRIESIVVSAQHNEEVKVKDLEEAIQEEVIKKIIPHNLIDKKTKMYINPTGRFVTGGPKGDAGLTGRKIIIDTYGGHGAHGGGAFSGKDPSKVDRSAAYAARYVAKHVVAAGLAEKALVQVAYAIGVATPVSFLVETFDTEKVSREKINKVINQLFDMRPKEIIKKLDLLRPIYSLTASYGHFGREEGNSFTWEKLNELENLKSHF